MPHAPDLSGRALDDRYELHAVIGEGAFGRVYRGWDRRLQRAVAIKMIKPWWAEDPAWERSFEREAQLLARISHPGIVGIFDVGHAAEGLYYVSELVDGESLASRLRRGALAPWDAAALAEELCRALAQAHAGRVIHRDVKPANILISADGRLKVGDFGVARLAEGSSDGANATIVGTPRYMAPEQARGRRATPATDVYSAGIVLYEMLAGRPPFTGLAVVELALRHLNDPPPPLPVSTPAALRRIVSRALAKDPAERYRDGAAMAEALAEALPSGPARPRSGGRTSARRHVTDAAVGGNARRGEPTRQAPKLGPRRNLNPAARRRRIAALSLAFVLLGSMIAAAIVIGAPARVRVPDIRGMTRSQAKASLTRAALRASFSSRYDRRTEGTAIAQAPDARTRAWEGSRVNVVLSAGPAPVKVPPLAGTQVSDAQAALQRIGLRARATSIPAPGVPAGLITSQSPAPGTELTPPGIVALEVAEVPQWRPLASLSGSGQATTARFRVRGTRWRIVYTMAYQGTCTFIFFCSGPQAEVDNVASGSSVDAFGLSDGGRQTRSFDTGAGQYELRIAPGSDTAGWSAWIEDYY